MATIILRSRGTIRMRTPAISATMGESSVAVMTMFASTMDCFLSAMAQVRAQSTNSQRPNCRSVLGGNGGERQTGALASRAKYSPPDHARSAWWGGVRGGGTFFLAPTLTHIAGAIFAIPPHRCAGEGNYPSIFEKSATVRVASRI